MTTRVWHDEEAYTRRSVARPFEEVRRDVEAFLDGFRELAERHGIADAICAIQTPAICPNGEGERLAQCFAHNGDNEQIGPMLAALFAQCVKDKLIDMPSKGSP